MQKNPLIGIGIIAIVLLILGSLTNVVGYQTVQSSNQKIIKDEVDQKELLFQIILDLANNKEIQKIIQKSEMKGGLERSLQVPGAILLLIKSRMRFSVVLPPQVLTKKYLEYVYTMGIRLLRTPDASKIHMILERYQVGNQGVQKELSAIIEENDVLNKEMKQLADIQCDCEKNNPTVLNFPILCALLFPIEVFIWMLVYFSLMFLGIDPYYIHILLVIIGSIGLTLNCFWV